MNKKEKYIYNIYWTNCYGTKNIVATTYNVNKWLDQNNKERIADGNEPESITEFKIEKKLIT